MLLKIIYESENRTLVLQYQIKKKKSIVYFNCSANLKQRLAFFQ